MSEEYENEIEEVYEIAKAFNEAMAVGNYKKANELLNLLIPTAKKRKG